LVVVSKWTVSGGIWIDFDFGEKLRQMKGRTAQGDKAKVFFQKLDGDWATAVAGDQYG
jgi:hypothetical protein